MKHFVGRQKVVDCVQHIIIDDNYAVSIYPIN
jgi:hypothetical protein